MLVFEIQFEQKKKLKLKARDMSVVEEKGVDSVVVFVYHCQPALGR